MDKDNLGKFSSDEMLIIISELDSHQVSLKAGNIFPITFSLIANVSMIT